MALTRGVFGRLIGGIKETTYNSDPTTKNAIIYPINSCGIKGEQTIQTSAALRGRRDPAKPFLGNTNVSGDVVVPVDAQAFGYWLNMLLGEPTTTGTGPYVHTYTTGNALDSYVLEGQFTDSTLYNKFNGCKANSLSMTVGGDGELVATINIIGGKETPGTSSIDSDPVSLTDIRFQNFQATITEGGSTLSVAKQVELTLSNNLDDSIYLIGGAGYRGALPEGILSVSGRLQTMFEDWTEYNKAVNGTETSLAITFTNGTNVLTITIPELIFGRNAPAIDGPNGVFLDAPFQGYWDDDADDTAIKVELTNDVVSYASGDIAAS